MNAASNQSLTAAAAPTQNAKVYELGRTFDALLTTSLDTAPVTRADALSIPACSRGVDLICTTVAGLPLERIDAQGTRMPLGWVEQPEAGRPRFATLVDTIRDLIFDGRAYWYVHDKGSDGAPNFGGCEYIALERVGNITEASGRPGVTIDGNAVDRSRVIGFHGWHNGIRHHGARILRTAIALEQAAKHMADAPLPNTLLKNVSTYELDDAEIDALLEGVRQARQASAVGYINAGVDMEVLGWDAAQLQLVEARMFTAAQIANLVGVPSGHIAGASASGASLTYQNVTQENRALVDFGLTGPIKALESRLSMSDVMGRAWQNQVTPRGTVIRFDLNGLLRGNPLERAQVYAQLIPLGVLTVEEARDIEDLAPQGRSTE